MLSLPTRRASHALHSVTKPSHHIRASHALHSVTEPSHHIDMSPIACTGILTRTSARGGSGELAAACSSSGVVQLYDVAAKSMHGPAFPSGCGVSQGIETWSTDSGTRVLCINSDGLISISSLDEPVSSLAAPPHATLFSPWLPSPSCTQHTVPRQGLKGPIERFRMSSDRRSVVAGGKNTLMQLWDVETSQVFFPLASASPAAR